MKRRGVKASCPSIEWSGNSVSRRATLNRMALIRNYDWFVAHRAEYRGKSGVTHRVPWRKGALRLAKFLF